MSLTLHGCFPGPDDADAAFDGPSDYVVEWQLETERAGGVDLDLVHEHAVAIDACVIDPS